MSTIIFLKKVIFPLQIHLRAKRNNVVVHCPEESITTQKLTMTLSESYPKTLKPKANRSFYCIFSTIKCVPGSR